MKGTNDMQKFFFGSETSLAERRRFDPIRFDLSERKKKAGDESDRWADSSSRM